MAGRKRISADSGAVDSYVSSSPKHAQARLKRMRALIQEAAPGAVETVSYFEIPGYSYEGYDYNGMFAWFSLKGTDVALHVRPPAIEAHRRELGGYETTRAIVRFPLDGDIPSPLVKKLVRDSVAAMKGGSKKAKSTAKS